MGFLTAIAFLVVAALQATASNLPTISTKGSKFFTNDGNQFFVRGVRYDRTVNDSLSDVQQCQTDAALMKAMGLNSIRIREGGVDLKVDHSGCMSAFADNGIYAWVHFEPENFWFDIMEANSLQPWNQTSLQSFEKIIDEFQKYPNTAGFFVGNVENVVSAGYGFGEGNSTLATYLKAAIHDTKAYRDSKNYRKIPIGYSDHYEKQAPSLVRNYLTCGKKASDSADFYSYMIYEECKEDGFDLESFVNGISEATVPVFISQLSSQCTGNIFNGMWSVYGNGTDNAWSGGIVNDWLYSSWRSQGMVIYGSTMTRVLDVYTMEPTTSVNFGKPTPVSNEWNSASSKWSRVAKITGVKVGGYEPKATMPPCPASSSPAWNLTGDVRLPTLVDRTEPISTGAKTEPTPSNKKKNGGCSLGLDMGSLCLVVASAMGLTFCL